MTFLRCSCRSFAAAQRPGASTPVKCTDAHRDGEGRPGESGLPNENSAERQAPSPICLIAKNFLKLAPQGQYGCRRILLNETNHLRPDRRRRFYLALIFSLQIRRLRTNNYSDYACKRNASRLHPALPATCRDRVAGVLLICNQAAKFLERQCLRASLNDATPWQQNDAVIAHQEPDIRIASAHWMFDDWLQPRSWTAFVSAFGSIIVTL